MGRDLPDVEPIATEPGLESRALRFARSQGAQVPMGITYEAQYALWRLLTEPDIARMGLQDLEDVKLIHSSTDGLSVTEHVQAKKRDEDWGVPDLQGAGKQANKVFDSFADVALAEPDARLTFATDAKLTRGLGPNLVRVAEKFRTISPDPVRLDSVTLARVAVTREEQRALDQLAGNMRPDLVGRIDLPRLLARVTFDTGRSRRELRSHIIGLISSHTGVPTPRAEIAYHALVGLLIEEMGSRKEFSRAEIVTLIVRACDMAPTHRVYAPPRPSHTLLGREHELRRIVRALREGHTVLLHGMGGMGKSHLAKHIARLIYEEGEFAEGVVWIDEIGDSSPALVCDAIARQMGGEDVLALPPEQKPAALRALLAAHNMLLVLDDLASPQSARSFVRTCLPPGTAVLVTSRRRHEVFGMRVEVAELGRDAAAALFLNRSGVGPDDDTVGRICQLLGDHPLALVIAAGRAGFEGMPLPNLRTRLENETTRLRSLRLGEEEEKDLSVRASLSVSYAELTEGQRRVFTYLAACFGDTTKISILADASGLTVVNCEDTVGQLVARSLVLRDGERVGLHRLVRDFGREALGTDLRDIQDKLVEVIACHVSAPEDVVSVSSVRLEAEMGNWLGAVRHAVECQRWALALRLTAPAITLGGTLHARGYWRQLEEVGRLGIDIAKREGDEESLAKFLSATATQVGALGRREEADQLLEESLAIYERLGIREGIAICLHNLALLTLEREDYEKSQELFWRAFELDEELGLPERAAHTLSNFSILLQEQGAYPEAARLLDLCHAMYEKLGDQFGIARVHGEMGHILHKVGDYAGARDLHEQSLEILERLGAKRDTAVALHQLGNIACARGEYGEARERYTRSLRMGEDLGDRGAVADDLLSLGNVAHAEGKSEEARRLYRRGLEVSEDLEDSTRIARGLYSLGLLAQAEGDHEAARDLYGRGLDIDRGLKNRSVMANCLDALGTIAFNEGNYAEAGRRYEESLELREQSGDEVGIAWSSHHLGDVAHKLGDDRRAKHLYERGLEIYERYRSMEADAVRQSLQHLEQCLVLQREFKVRIESREATLAMGAVGHEVAVLPVAQHFQGPGRIGRAPGQDDAEQQVGLGQGQGRGLFPPTGTGAARGRSGPG